MGKLNDDQRNQLKKLRRIAGDANAVIKYFVFDQEMVRRWQTNSPTVQDIALLATALIEAGSQFAELAAAEFGLDNHKEIR